VSSLSLAWNRELTKIMLLTGIVDKKKLGPALLQLIARTGRASSQSFSRTDD
jgi:hypothetical protein